jgi:hypothetical protein
MAELGSTAIIAVIARTLPRLLGHQLIVQVRPKDGALGTRNG